MNFCERHNKITELIGKFKNGEELYRTNATFNVAINALVEGADVYDVLEQVIVSKEQLTKTFTDYISRDTRPAYVNYPTSD